MTTDGNELVLGDNPSLPDAYSDEGKIFGTDGVITPNQETPPEGDVEDAEFIKLSRKELQANIDRLRVEDKDFSQVYNRDIGNKAAAKYKPEIELLRKQNEALQLAIRQREYQSLTQEQVNERFTRDPEFAKDYATVTHATPDLNVGQPNAEVISREILNTVQSSLEFATRLLPQNVVDVIKQEIAAGKYDVDDTGEKIGLFNWREGTDRLQRDISNHISGLNKGTVTQPVSTPSNNQAPVTRVDTSSPDLSPSGGRGAGRQTFTIQQVREMSVEEKLRRWPNDGDIDAAVSSGEIKLSV